MKRKRTVLAHVATAILAAAAVFTATVPAQAVDWIYADGPEKGPYTYDYSSVGSQEGGYGWVRGGSVWVTFKISTVNYPSGSTVAGSQNTGFMRADYNHPAKSSTRGKCFWHWVDISHSGNLSKYCVTRNSNQGTRLGPTAGSSDNSPVADPSTLPNAFGLQGSEVSESAYSWHTTTNESGEICLIAVLQENPEYWARGCALPHEVAKWGLALSFETEDAGYEDAYFLPDPSLSEQAADEKGQILIVSDSDRATFDRQTTDTVTLAAADGREFIMPVFRHEDTHETAIALH